MGLEQERVNKAIQGSYQRLLASCCKNSRVYEDLEH